MDRTRRANDVNSSEASGLLRTGSVLTKQPTIGSKCSVGRPATGIPMTRSSFPVYRCSSVRKAARKKIPGLISWEAVKAAMAAARSSGNRLVCTSPT
ncbi:hypothetical protein SCYAM73S_07706 [Streptomyces cyaneofuscatus]